MKPRFRFLTLTLLLAMVVAVLPAKTPASAQDDCPPGLGSTDCDLFNEANDTLGNATSFNITSYTFNFQLRTNGDTTMLMTEGSGPVLFENGEIVGLDISFDPATFTSNQDTQTGGGVLRINGDGAFLGTMEDDSLSWSGLAGDTEIEGTDAGDLDSMLGDLGGQNFGNIITFSRADGQTVNGRDVAVFVADIDTAGFVRSPFFTDLASQALVGLMTDQEIDPTFAAILIQTLLDQVASDLEENNVIQSSFHVDPATGEFTYFSLLVDLTIDLGFVRGFSPDIDAMIPEGGIGIGIDLQANIADYNANPEIATPESYEDLGESIEDLLGEFMGDGLPFDLGFSPAEESGLSATSAEFTVILGETATGVLSTENDSDIYLFEATAGTSLQIAVRDADGDSGLDPIIELYSIDGTLIDQNDDAFDAPDTFDLAFLDSYISYTVEEDGQYLIVVSAVFPVTEEAYELFVVAEVAE